METIYDTLCTSIDQICTQYGDCGIQKTVFGASYLGRQIPALQLGTGSHRLLYLGGMTGDVRSAALLLHFARDYAEAVRGGMRICGIDISYLQHTRCITVVPLLNVDGAILRCDGTDEKNPLLPRLLSMTGAHGDEANPFAHWVCSGRGVDLRYNFDYDFTRAMTASHGIGGAGFPGMHPESEPECAAVAGYLRGAPTTDLALIFGDGADAGVRCGQIAWSGGDHRTRALAQILARDIDGRGYETDSVCTHGSLCDWYRGLHAGPLLHITLPADASPTDDKHGEPDDTEAFDREQLHALLDHGGSAPGDTLARAALALQYGKLRKMLFHGAVL
ncbi:MAG: hypothetical protein IKZ09_01305 [Clostridia bacterium]|nr:hypothetical protein [Clostridia bacterium]